MARHKSGASVVRETGPGYVVDVGARGRVVLPADLRRRLAVKTGDRFAVTVDDDGSIHLRRREDIARSFMGAYKGLATGRHMSDELIRERRREAKREDAE